MLRQLLALALIAILHFPSSGLADHTQKIEKQAHRARDQIVLVRLKSGHETRGRIGPCSEESFTLRSDAGDQQLSYQDVRSIGKVKPPRSAKGWKIAGAVVLGVVVTVGILILANRNLPVRVW